MSSSSINVRLTNQVRIDQTCRELHRLLAEVQEWLTHRREADKAKQYFTQLNTLDAALIGPLGEMRAALATLSDTEAPSQVYTTCRTYDKRVTLVRRVWSYYRDRFDQRDDPTLKPVLAAADEVVWSCYAEVFERASFHAKRTIPRGTAPLPYIEPQYSPQAIPRDEAPEDVKANADDKVLARYLLKLPIPIVTLPPVCIREPWWMVFLGHEVGHHVQYDLLPDWGLVGSFGRLLHDTVCSAPTGDNKAAQRWQQWGREIFADICSVCSMGPAAVRAMVELELADDETMLGDGKVRYPASAVRLGVLARVADELELDGQEALEIFNPDEFIGATSSNGVEATRARAAAALKLAAHVIPNVVMAPLADLGSFRELYGWEPTDFAPGGTLELWRDDLLEAVEPRPHGQDGANLQPELSSRAPRMIIAGAVAAWRTITRIADEQDRRERLARLAAVLLPVVAQSREDLTRGADAVAEPDVRGLGGELATLLFDEIHERSEP